MMVGYKRFLDVVLAQLDRAHPPLKEKRLTICLQLNIIIDFPNAPLVKWI